MGTEPAHANPVTAQSVVAQPAALRVGIVHTVTAANTRNYRSGTRLNNYYTGRVDQVKRLLDSQGFVTAYVDDAGLASLATLRQFDVLVFTMTLATTPAQRTAILAYASEGGGIVGSFALSRWDASPSYRFGYLPFLGMHGYPGVFYWPASTAALKPWEWGEISEIYNVKFRDDPRMYGPYNLESASSHWILTNGFAAGESRRLVDRLNRFNEILYTMPGARNVTPLYRYNTRVDRVTTDDVQSGHLAAWTSEYYFGRFVYFGFHMHDLIVEGQSADARTASVARRVLVNSVRWAGTRSTYFHLPKAVSMTGSAWYTRETLFINQTVTNRGGVSLRGPLRVEVRDPAGQVVYRGQAYDDLTPLPPGWSYTHRSYQIPLRNPRPGTWRIRMTYQYFDYFRGGWPIAERTLFIDSTGRAMSGSRLGAQALTNAGNRPVIGSRIAGNNRYTTTIALANHGWPNGASTSNTVILATGAGYADALAAAPLAGRLDAPLLLLPPTGLTSEISGELRRLFSGRQNATLLVVGGEAAVSQSAVNAARQVLAAAGTTVTIDRLWGNDRYGTARAIAQRVGTPSQGAFARTAIVVSGENYPDALAVGALAAEHGIPLLPVRPNSVPSDIESALQTLGIQNVTIVGGSAAVSPAVEQWLETNGYRRPGVADGSLNVNTRLAGANRYNTALAVKRYSVAFGGLRDQTLFFATGRNWPDALALGPVAARQGNAAILIDGTEIGGSPTVANYLMSRRATPPTCIFIGGTGAISDYVRGQVRIALGR